MIDGRPIREPISGSAVFILELIKALKHNKVVSTLFVQSNENKNKLIDNIKHDSFELTKGNKTFENIIYELGINKNKQVHINHETYFGRLPFKSDKMIATIHDVIPLDFPEWFTWKNSVFAKRNFYRQIRNADYCIFSSKYTQSRAETFGDILGESVVVPLAVSEGIHKNSNKYFNLGNASGALNLVKPHSYVLAIGNVEPRKNLSLIAEALSIINKKLNLDLDLVIAGHANFDSKSILNEVDKKLGKAPVILGFVSNEEKYELYKHCACHVYASKYEGFGIPPVESIVIGAPTVIASNSSLKELIPSQKLGFDANSVSSLVAAIEKNLFQNSHEVIGSKVNDYINFYKWDRVARDYSNIYAKLK
jgi:glycosyltransferase involved in cell wall biosynthesis